MTLCIIVLCAKGSVSNVVSVANGVNQHPAMTRSCWPPDYKSGTKTGKHERAVGGIIAGRLAKRAITCDRCKAVGDYLLPISPTQLSITESCTIRS